MAQPTNYVIDYIAGIKIKAGTTITGASVLVTYPTAKVMQLLTKDVKISINATDAVTFTIGDFAYISSSHTWTFTNDCEVAIGIVVNLAV